ncbi:MAG: laccase domain-containing protein [Deltaproteobacteria bacterium]|nr:laccase domain-containing protein [Deltaproteobacteria bacterium]
MNWQKELEKPVPGLAPFFTLDMGTGPAYIKPDGPPFLTAGFTLRAGGVSRGAWAEANFSFNVGDDPAAVRNNRRALLERVGAGRFPRLITLHQVHGSLCLEVPENLSAEWLARPEVVVADALITSRPGILLGIQTADCLPLILVADTFPVVAVVHVGWRGLEQGIGARTARKMIEDYGADPSRIQAYAGPAIGRCCFQVGREVIDVFRRKSYLSAESAWFDKRPDGFYLDLAAVLQAQLAGVGIMADNFYSVDLCTVCHGFCFSYRRDHAITGRQLAFAGIVPE